MTKYISLPHMYRLLRIATLALLSLLALAPEAMAERRVYQLIEYGIVPDTDRDTSAPLARLLAQIRTQQHRGDSITLVFAPGRYYFDATHAPRKQVYISNHDQQATPRAFGILLEGWQGLTIDGMGAQFVFRHRMLPIGVVGCGGVQLRGFSIDFDQTQMMQARIVANRGAEGLVLEPHADYLDVSRGRLDLKGRDWTATPHTGIAFDGATRHTLYRVSDLSYSTSGLRPWPTEGARPHYLAPAWVDDRLVAGTIVAMRTYERPNPGIFVDDSRDTSIERVAVHYADGMGLLAQNSHNVALRAFDVRPSAGRCYSTQADATHFSGCSGHIDVRQGHYEAMMDDAINVHGVYLRLTKRIDDYTFVGRYMHDQAWGIEWGRRGDTIQFIASKTFDPIRGSYTISSIEPHDRSTVAGAREFRIRTSQRLPREVNEHMSIGVENMRKTPSVTFAHNTITNNRARGTLFNTPKPVLVEYNRFDNISGSGILVSTDCNIWFESGRTCQMLIRGNVFVDVLTSLYQFTEAVISICPVIPELEKQRAPFYGDGADGIRVEDNLFMTFDTPLLFARSVNGLSWRRNTVVRTTTYPLYHPNQERYILKGSLNVRIDEGTNTDLDTIAIPLERERLEPRAREQIEPSR